MSVIENALDRSDEITLPAKRDFAPMALTFLDSATTHPLSLGGKKAVEAYLEARTYSGDGRGYFAGPTEKRVLNRFAALINASPHEVCFVPSTTAGEHLVIAALDLPASGGRIVTDTLHFFGSYYLYDELAKRGLDVVWLNAREGRVPIGDIEAAVTRGTRLVALSLVSTINGFQHDLKKVCEIAHAKGAYVYADIIHAAGCSPVDIKESGVDFAACSSFKWLMGDFGLGFLYVREDLLEKVKRTQFGYYQLASFRTPAFPMGPPTEQGGDGYAQADGATGLFALGTISHAALVQLDWSLDYILKLGVERIQRYREPMMRRLKAELPRLGYPLMTPVESTAPLVACALADARSLGPRLEEAKVKIALARDRFRVSLSVFNDMSDIDRLFEALS